MFDDTPSLLNTRGNYSAKQLLKLYDEIIRISLINCWNGYNAYVFTTQNTWTWNKHISTPITLIIQYRCFLLTCCWSFWYPLHSPLKVKWSIRHLMHNAETSFFYHIQAIAEQMNIYLMNVHVVTCVWNFLLIGHKFQ